MPKNSVSFDRDDELEQLGLAGIGRRVDRDAAVARVVDEGGVARLAVGDELAVTVEDGVAGGGRAAAQVDGELVPLEVRSHRSHVAFGAPERPDRTADQKGPAPHLARLMVALPLDEGKRPSL
jgi:hypothetical protein